MAQFKLNEAFSADDFTIDALPVGQERYSVFEINIKEKTCLFRISDDTYQVLTLNDELTAALLSALEPNWHSEADQMQIFALFNDGEYYCQKMIAKYNFSTKAVTRKTYENKNFTLDEAKEIFEIAKAVCWIRTEQLTESLEADLVNIAETDNYAERLFNERKAQRNELLTRSDFRVLPDVPEDFSGATDLWIQWRAALRTIPKAEDQFEDKSAWLAYLGEMPFPIDPLKYHVVDESHATAYLQDDSHWTTMISMAVSSADELLAQELTAMKARKAEIDKFGKRINLQLRDVIRKYEIDRNIMNFDLSSYTPVED